MLGLRSSLLATAAVLWRRPGYALTAIGTLALGIGAATAVYALLHGILLQPLPFPQAAELVVIRQQNQDSSWNTSVVDYQAVAAETRSFRHVAAMRSGEALVGSGERAQWVGARHVTASYFDLLGVAPTRGRTFAPGDDALGAAPTVVISQGFAERHFGAEDPLGRSLPIDGTPHTVIGVMPAGVEAFPAMRAELWPVLSLATPERRGPFFLSTLARLAPGVDAAQATSELDALSRRLFSRWQAGFQDGSARLVPFDLHQLVVGGSSGFLWLAFAAVAVVLLIALVNVAHLMLMRLAQRAQDLGIRAALGASRWRLVRLLLGENLVLVTLGTLGGLALAALLLAQYRALGPALPRLSEVALAPPVLGFAGALALGCGALLALLPLLRSELGALGARGASSGRARQRLRDGLVVLEFALALPLLLAAALLVASLWRLQRVDPGFDPTAVLSANVRLPAGPAYAEPSAQIAFWQRALPALAALPGVRGVALAGALPPSCGCNDNFDLLARPAADGNQPQSPFVPVDGGYFATLGIPVLEGRSFDTRDTPESTRVLIVTRSWAERYFPGQSALGQQLYEGGDTERPLTIIGVVGDVKFDSLQAPGETVFAPASQGWGGGEMYVLLRSAGDPLALAQPLQRVLRELDPALVPSQVQSLPTLLGDALGGERHWATVIAGFAGAALLLAAVGVFGVLAYQVTQRERELGIRQALGADAPHIVALVLRRGLKCAALGVAVGSVLALFVSRGLESLLFEVERTDPLTWLAASALLLAVAGVACWLPARRAAALDPLRALRQE
jgi:putative ABC transport system permease protein